ncbi:HNH endonuclease [Actinoalloteichus sp. AHMU CJ021]|uniref:GmrSD restriction endonucleases C-terminal domain-containing protein n=1 Tax=Actinoalloteichus caeruleus DSM 43889 TaxID=1120930 RepID=A0ABT1JBS1_ACTCY|nr:HNH endonuclease family protein [Actinoalloteichus caeruleus]AUS80572.1 HNH endonuclease [Actinoalloteichus sp. AHMU CJ021]MCP2329947.1 Protein of unknown function (DUF1524) [Actinoalloteichus caeruleus DSM 43889]
MTGQSRSGGKQQNTTVRSVLITLVAVALVVVGYVARDHLPFLDDQEQEIGSGQGAPTPGDADGAAALLDELEIAAERPMRGYSRDRFRHWISQGDNCNTRETVLVRDGVDVVTDEECRSQSGTWHSVYDDEEFDDASDLDIDHVVPLAAGWRSGADEWDDERRERFANDLDTPQLIAVSASSNRAKGDQTPDQWKPPATGYWCTYAQDWIAVKHHWELTVTEPERAALLEMLDHC